MKAGRGIEVGLLLVLSSAVTTTFKYAKMNVASANEIGLSSSETCFLLEIVRLCDFEPGLVLGSSKSLNTFQAECTCCQKKR